MTKEQDSKTKKVETTGHEWDGIEELNNPLPRWWLWIFILCCIWAFGYWVVYPAWPTLSGNGERGGTKGSIGWTQYKQLKTNQNEIAKRKLTYLNKFQQSSFEEIMSSPELFEFALAGGKAAFKDNCATCHGSGGEGALDYPNLNDDDWLWGGSVAEIYQTIKYGIRAKNDKTHNSQMPAFKHLKRKDVNEIVTYVLSLNDSAISYTARGEKLFQANCSVCHGKNGKGDRAQGAPNIADSIWLHGAGGGDEIASQIVNPKHGVMPNWNVRLDEETIRELAVYVHSLGGGE